MNDAIGPFVRFTHTKENGDELREPCVEVGEARYKPPNDLVPFGQG